MRIPIILTRNLRLKALAAVLAVFTWGIVVYAANPPDSRTVSVPVPDPSPGIPYVLESPTAPLSVRVTGTREHVQAFDPGSSLSLRPDYSVIRHGGPQQIPVVIVNSDRNVGLDSPPTTVSVDVDEVSTRSLPVGFRITQTPPPGFINRTPVLTPNTVIVNGPKRLLTNLEARVDIDLHGQKSTIAVELQVFLLDHTSGRPPPTNRVGVDRSTVNASVEIDSQTTSRTVPVVLTVSGNPPRGSVLTGISVDPPTVTISGPAVVVNTIDQLSVPVSVSGLSTTTTLVEKLSTGRAGVTSSNDTVNVRVSVASVSLPSPSPTPAPTPAPPAPAPTP